MKEYSSLRAYVQRGLEAIDELAQELLGFALGKRVYAGVGGYERPSLDDYTFFSKGARRGGKIRVQTRDADIVIDRKDVPKGKEGIEKLREVYGLTKGDAKRVQKQAFS